MMGRERFIMAKKQHFYPKQISPLRDATHRFGRNDSAVARWVWFVSLGVVMVGIGQPTFAAGP